MSLRIRKFDPTSIKESRITFLLAKRGIGKSVMMRDLLYHGPKPDFVLAMAPTEDSIRGFREFLPETCIFNHFSQEKLERTLNMQRELINRGKKRRVLIILDDCLYQKGVLKSTAMRNLFFNGRHLHTGLICAAQYLMDISPELRTNIDYVFAGKESTIANRKKLYQFFFGQFPKFDEFDRVMTACTQSYSMICMDSTQPSTKVSEVVFWYRASQDIPPFKLCLDIYWKLALRCGRDEEEQRRAQNKQFEVERAAAEARAAAPQAARITVVQTEDENGQIVTSTASAS